MMQLRVVISRLRALLGMRGIDREFEQELESHLAMLTEENVRRGMSPEASRRAARLRLGNPESLRVTNRELRGIPWIEALLQDVRLSIRALRARPGFAAFVILTLALGIGATTAIFTVVNRVILEPLPYPHSNRIVGLVQRWGRNSERFVSVPEYLMWRGLTRILEDAAADGGGEMPVNLLGGDHPEQLQERRVTADLFALYGYQVVVGRTFTSKEDVPGGPQVAVISNGLWRRRFRADPGVVGKVLDLGGTVYTVIGVLAPLPLAAREAADVYLPLQPDPNSTSLAVGYYAYGRLKPGVTVAEADAALKVATDLFRRKYPEALGSRDSFATEPLQDLMVAGWKESLLIFLGAVGFVLLIACANAANLLLARETGRQREIAIRVALGSSRGRIVRQILTEGALLSFVGGALGLLVGYGGVRALLAVNPGQLPGIGQHGEAATLDWRVLLFALGISALAGLLSGIVPAIKASHTNLAAAMKESGSRAGTGMRHNKTRSLLVVAEMALAMVLLAGAGLLIRAFLDLRSVNPGFQAHNVLTMDISLSGARFAKTAAVAALVREGQQRLDSLPGVEVAAASCCLPLEGGVGLPFNIEGRKPAYGQWTAAGEWRSVSPGYFRALRIPLLRGRDFTVNDSGSSEPVVIINEAMGKQYWPKGGALGTRIVIGKGDGMVYADLPREIVGVVGDVRDNSLYYHPVPTMYVPVAQVADGFNALVNTGLPMTWILRTRVAPFSLSEEIQHQLRLASGGLPVGHVRTMEQVVADSTEAYSFVTILMDLFAALALLLAAVGIYGVLAYSVEQRTQEIGIRMALGASPYRVRRRIAAQGMALALVGVGIGVGGAMALTWLLRSLLFGVKPWDPLAFGAAAAVLLLGALLACTLPALRASRIDPAISLRFE